MSDQVKTEIPTETIESRGPTGPYDFAIFIAKSLRGALPSCRYCRSDCSRGGLWHPWDVTASDSTKRKDLPRMQGSGLLRILRTRTSTAIRYRVIP